MPSSKGKLQAVEPQPIDENTPLISGGRTDDAAAASSSLEAQARAEQRQHDANTVPLADEPSTSVLLFTMGSLWITTFFAALDNTVVATLSSPISSSFQSGKSFAWIASGYLIANAAFQPLSGKLTDIFGRRAGLIFAVTFFSLGTLICAVATEGWVMILGRVVAGSGGGCLNTVSVFVASDLIPLRKRGMWQGIGNIVYGAGMGLGGVFGGAINDRLGWRFAFYLQLPFIVLGGLWSIFMVKIPVKETDSSKVKRVDFLGAFTLVAALVLLLIGLNSGGNIVPWNHPLVYVSLPLSLIFLCFFVYVEDRIASEPVIPVRLLLHQSVAAGCLTNWFGTMSVYGLLFYGPIFFEAVRGVTSTEAGIMFVPHAAGTAAGSLGAGMLMRWTGKYWWLNIFTQILFVSGAALILGTWSPTLPLAPSYLYLLMSGLAWGAILTISLIALISAVDHKYQAVITSASYASRSTGSSIGVAVASAVFQNLLQDRLYQRFGHLAGAAHEIQRIRDSTAELKHLPDGWRPGVIDAYVEALRGVWLVVLAFAVLTATSSLFIKQHTLHGNLERK